MTKKNTLFNIRRLVVISGICVLVPLYVVFYASCDTGEVIHPLEGPEPRVYSITKMEMENNYYWADGEKVYFPQEQGITKVRANYIFVSDGIVYLAGYYVFEGMQGACYWKDEGQGPVMIDLPLGDGDSASVKSLFVRGGTVYMAGNINKKAGPMSYHYIPCYWKDDGDGPELIILDPSVTYVNTNSIFVSDDNTVYVLCETYYNLGKCFWKHEEGKEPEAFEIVTEDDERTYLNNIIIPAEGITYIACDTVGHTIDRYKAGYWKYDGETREFFMLESPGEEYKVTMVNSMTVSGGSVYIAGYYQVAEYQYKRACYWKDGKFYKLHLDNLYSSNATSIAVHQGIVYAAGQYFLKGNDNICYWKDGLFYPVGGTLDPDWDSTSFIVFE